MSDEKEIARRIARILRLLAGKIEENPDMLRDMELIIRDIPSVSRKRKVEEHPIDFDIFHVFAEGGEHGLRRRLESVELKTLKGIIRQHGFDVSKLADKWRNKERLVNLVTERVAARSDKGKVFKNYP